MMLAPWVLLPVIVALRGEGSVRVLAARSALAVALMGAVNAVATLTGCLAALIWWACHRPNRLWWRFTAWWALCIGLAITWWVVALVLLGRISPPFLDFIESSGVTTQWLSLTEVLRGTDSWTPFVAPNATAGASLVTGSVAVLATTLVAAAGLAGLAMRSMPARGRLITMLLIGIVLLAAGILRRAGIAGGPSGAGIPRRGRHPAAQHAQARAGDPAAAGARPGASARPHPAAGQRAATGVAERVRPSRKRQAGGRRHRGAGGAGGRHVAGVDRAGSPRRGHSTRSRSTGTTPPTGSTRTTPERPHPDACWWCPARRSPPRSGAPAMTSRCRFSATARGGCATRFR